MPRDSSSVRISRILSLIKDFISTEKLYKKELYERYGYTNRKTIQRDMAFLRDELGVQIIYDRKGGFYQLTECGPGFMVRSPVSEEEALAILIGIKLAGHFLPFFKETATSLATKLKRIMPEKSRTQAGTLSEAVILANPVSKIDESVFKKVVDAIHERKVVKTQYRSPYEDPPQDRLHYISPWFIYFKHKAWYVWGKSNQYDESSSFRISRFRYAEIVEDYSYEEPPKGLRLEDLVYAENPFCSQTYELKLKIKEPFATSVKDILNLYPDQDITKTADGHLLLSAKVRNLEEVSRWVLSAADCVEILEPEELKEIVKRKAEILLASIKRRGGN